MNSASQAAAPPRYRVTTPPLVEPCTLQEIKDHCRVFDTADDAYLALLLSAAREMCELLQNRAYITQTITCTLDAFPWDDSPIDLPRAPLQSVTSVTYTRLVDGLPVVLSPSTYIVDAETAPGRIVTKALSGYDWPQDDLVDVNGLVIVYVAGYGMIAGPTAGRPPTMPLSIIHAIKFLVGHWYENREAIGDQASGNAMPVPLGFASLLQMERLGGFA